MVGGRNWEERIWGKLQSSCKIKIKQNKTKLQLLRLILENILLPANFFLFLLLLV